MFKEHAPVKSEYLAYDKNIIGTNYSTSISIYMSEGHFGQISIYLLRRAWTNGIRRERNNILDRSIVNKIEIVKNDNFEC